MAAQTGFLRCGDIMRLSCRLTTQPSAAARASVTCPAKAEDGKGRADGAAVTRIRRAATYDIPPMLEEITVQGS